MLAASGVALFSLNGSMARYLLDDGVDAARLSRLRSAGACLILLVVLGLAAVHATFFVAINWLEIGPAVTIQLGGTLVPVLAAVFAWVIHEEALAAVRMEAGRPCSPRWPGCSRAAPVLRVRRPPKAFLRRDFLRVKPGGLFACERAACLGCPRLEQYH